MQALDPILDDGNTVLTLLGKAGEKLERMPEADPNDHVLGALQSLPLRWQQVLWYAEVQGETPQRIGTLMGIKPNTVLSMLRRARAALRIACIHLEPRNTPEEDVEQISAPEPAGVTIASAGG